MSPELEAKLDKTLNLLIKTALLQVVPYDVASTLQTQILRDYKEYYEDDS